MADNAIFQKLCSDLRALGIAGGDTILVHSSLRALGPLPGNRAEIVTDALLNVLGPEGTLLLPALSYDTVTEENPVFDVRNTPCCVGGLPNYFLHRPETIRSIHPTHSVAGVGRYAEQLLRGHERDTTSCGPNSPFRKLRELGTWILFLGCGIASNTSMHAVEELVDPPYLHKGPVEYRILLPDGSETRMRVRRHDFEGYAQAYARLARMLEPGTELRRGPVLSADCTLMSIPALWEKGAAALKRDPLAFVWKYSEA